MIEMDTDLVNALIDANIDVRWVQRIIERAVKEEREACALIAETAHDKENGIGEAVGWDADCIDEAIAIAIRKRGTE